MAVGVFPVTWRLGVAALLVAWTGCLPPRVSGAPPPGSASAPGPAADPSCLHDARVEAEVAAALEREIRAIGIEPDLRVDTSFECPRLAAPRWMVGLRSHGHGGALELLGVHAASEDHVELREVVLRARPSAPRLGDPPPPIDFIHVEVSGERARHALAFARAAMAARVALVAPAPAGDALSIATSQTDDDEEIELKTSGARAQDLSRQWQGYRGSESESDLAPIELAFAALTELLPARGEPRPDGPDRELLADAWDSRFPHARWVEERLLDLASVLGTPRLLPKVLAALSSAHETEQLLAVRALATITGHDRIRDAGGSVRPLSAVVGDYRAQVGAAR